MQSVIINHIISTADWNKVAKSDNYLSVDQESGLEVQIVQGLNPKKTGYLKGIFKAVDDLWKIQLVNKNDEIITIQINFAEKVDTLHISGGYIKVPSFGEREFVPVGRSKKINLGFVTKKIAKAIDVDLMKKRKNIPIKAIE
ncbi:hypothetical protein MUP35_04690 [Patescibacteria group bacterium]|nr:hypothetical protein [Patescibacteria group bacterium]